MCLVDVGGVGRRTRVEEWVEMSFSAGQQAMPVESYALGFNVILVEGG